MVGIKIFKPNTMEEFDMKTQAGMGISTLCYDPVFDSSRLRWEVYEVVEEDTS